MFPITIKQASTEHRIYQAIGWLLLIAVMFILPFWLPEYQVGRLNRMILMAVAVLGLNMVVGFNGLLALCHSAFIGLGAFATGYLVDEQNWDYWMTVPVGMFIAFMMGIVIGVPALRIKGLYLALTTVAFAATFPSLAKLEVLGIADATGGANGREIREKLLPPGWAQDMGFDVNEPARYGYFLILAMAIVAFWMVSNLMKSRPGRAVIAIRDNETGAAVSGVNTRNVKVLNFGLSAALGGLAGSMWAMNTGFVAEQDYNFVLMVDLLVALVIGGVATIGGSVIGAAVVVFVREYTKSFLMGVDTLTWRIGVAVLVVGAIIFAFTKKPKMAMVGAGLIVAGLFFGLVGFDYEIDGNGPLSQAIFGVILILVTFFAPQGVMGLVRKIRSAIIRIVPNPPGEWSGASGKLSAGLVDVTGDATATMQDGSDGATELAGADS